jgi:hypothetical protein
MGMFNNILSVSFPIEALVVSQVKEIAVQLGQIIKTSNKVSCLRGAFGMIMK